MRNIETSVSEFKVGRAVIDVTPSSLSVGSGEDRFHQGITLKSDADNDGTIYIGCKVHANDAEVSSSNYPLDPGESVTLQVDAIAKVRCVATEAGQVLHWSGS